MARFQENDPWVFLLGMIRYAVTISLYRPPSLASPWARFQLTILPSPLPRSMTFPERSRSILITLSTCRVVAGTYGRQNFLRAGSRNGVVTANTVTNEAALTPSNILPVLVNFGFSFASDSLPDCSTSITVVSDLGDYDRVEFLAMVCGPHRKSSTRRHAKTLPLK